MPTPSGQRLKILAQANGLYIGYASASGFGSLSDASSYEATAAAEYNILTPENDMKWVQIHPAQTTYSFTAADQHVTFAQNNGLAVHGHNLAWGSSNPSWLTGGSWTSSTLTAVLDDHIDTVVGHYAGQVKIWDVVNEPINTSSIWNSVIGSTYIDHALRRAHTADSNALLILNEFGAEVQNSVSDSYYSMCQSLLGGGAPLGGVGFQMHVDGSGIDYTSFAANMARFAALGLKILITEMDVRIPASPSGTDLSNQAAVYQSVMEKCLLEPACMAVQTWGFTDAYSWIPGFFSGFGAALPFDASYAAKPAYTSIQGSSALGQAGLSSATVLDPMISRRAWSKLVRDPSNSWMISGTGATAALSSDGRLGLVKLSVNATVTVDMRRMASVARARWYDPSNGTFSDVAGGPFVNDGSRSFTPSATNNGGGTNWILVLEALDPGAPGTWVSY